LPVFYFRDGQIMFLCSEEPATITAQRCMGSISKFKHGAIVDSSGETHSSDSPAEVWEGVDLRQLFLGDDEWQEEEEFDGDDDS
jgi:hypothetical protein